MHSLITQPFFGVLYYNHATYECTFCCVSVAQLAPQKLAGSTESF